MTVDANVNGYFSDADRVSLQQLKFQVIDPSGYFSKLEYDLTRFNNKFESGG